MSSFIKHCKSWRSSV